MAEIKIVPKASLERRRAPATKTASATETVRDSFAADSRADSRGRADLTGTALKARREDFPVRDSVDDPADSKEGLDLVGDSIPERICPQPEDPRRDSRKNHSREKSKSTAARTRKPLLTRTNFTKHSARWNPAFPSCHLKSTSWKLFRFRIWRAR